VNHGNKLSPVETSPSGVPSGEININQSPRDDLIPTEGRDAIAGLVRGFIRATMVTWRDPTQLFRPRPLSMMDVVHLAASSDLKASLPLSNLQSLKHCWQTYGWRNTASMMALPMVANWGISFGMFSTFTQLERRFNSTKPRSSKMTFYSGMAAGTMQALLSTPFEIGKTHLQASADCRYLHLAMIELVKANGGNPLVLYRGIHLTLLRDIFSLGMFFGSYVEGRYQCIRFVFGVEHMHDLSKWSQVTCVTIAGTLSGLSYVLVATPLGTVRRMYLLSRAEKRSDSFRNLFKALYREHGLTGYFIGVTRRLVRVLPGAIASLLVLELFV
jgi:hypothetical protein